MPGLLTLRSDEKQVNKWTENFVPWFVLGLHLWGEFMGIWEFVPFVRYSQINYYVSLCLGPRSEENPVNSSSTRYKNEGLKSLPLICGRVKFLMRFVRILKIRGFVPLEQTTPSGFFFSKLAQNLKKKLLKACNFWKSRVRWAYVVKWGTSVKPDQW